MKPYHRLQVWCQHDRKKRDVIHIFPKTKKMVVKFTISVEISSITLMTWSNEGGILCCLLTMVCGLFNTVEIFTVIQYGRMKHSALVQGERR